MHAHMLLNAQFVCMCVCVCVCACVLCIGNMMGDVDILVRSYSKVIIFIP